MTTSWGPCRRAGQVSAANLRMASGCCLLLDVSLGRVEALQGALGGNKNGSYHLLST